MKVAALLVIIGTTATACAATDEDALVVFAASSLTDTFGSLRADARFNFAGSDELATQIREGADADVYASAAPGPAQDLFAEGLTEQPVTFATNELVMIVPADDSAVNEPNDLVAGHVRLVVGDEGVPAGDYAREALAALGLDRVVDGAAEEQDVRAIVGKVALGEADAGFVYATDARGDTDVRALTLPRRAQPAIEYSVAIVKRGNRRAAEGFVDSLLGRAGRRALEDAGFGLP